MSTSALSRKLTTWFEHTHDNPPAAFNPAYIPCMSAAVDEIAQAMEDEGFYADHTRPECATEFKRRIDLFLKTVGSV